MDATLFTGLKPVDRTNLIGTAGEGLIWEESPGEWEIEFDGADPQAENFSAIWANKIVDNVIRAAGIAGSAVVSIANNANTIGWSAEATFALPPGLYGTLRPPAIWVSVQYGSTILYKRFADEYHSFVVGKSDSPLHTSDSIEPPLFHTFIENLHAEATNMGGSELIIWKFKVKHYYRAGQGYVGAGNPKFFTGDYVWRSRCYQAPYKGMAHQWLPIDTWYLANSQIIIHYYALGADTGNDY